MVRGGRNPAILHTRLSLKQRLKFIIAGGRTGGHLFPGIAVAQAISKLEPQSSILFVGTGEPFETRTVARYGFQHRRILSSGIKGKGVIEKVKALLQIPLSIVQAIMIIRDFKPNMVMGVGGYASGPVLLSARLCRTETAIQEQNSIAGITNRILSRLVHVIFTTFRETKGLDHSKTTIHTGNPVRKKSIGNPCAVVDSTTNSEPSLEQGNIFTILVTGGSQGAKSINTAILEAVKLLTPSDHGEYRIIHQTGSLDEDRVIKAYEQMKKDRDIKVKITAKAFFHDMNQLMARADLTICRAGAGTISELTALGRPALLIPYPHAADDHQTSNAKALVEQDAAWMVRDSALTGQLVEEKITFAAENSDFMENMADRALKFGTPHADEAIARACINMARGNNMKSGK